MEAFLHRLAFLESAGADQRRRPDPGLPRGPHLLGRLRAMGLTRPGGPAAGLGEDFTLAAGDVPVKPEDPANRTGTCPPEIMRQLCEQLPAWNTLTSPEIRIAVELIIDTGRRPDEICALRWDCLDPRRGPARRCWSTTTTRPTGPAGGCRSPSTPPTVIIAQQERVRARFPDTPLAS